MIKWLVYEPLRNRSKSFGTFVLMVIHKIQPFPSSPFIFIWENQFVPLSWKLHNLSNPTQQQRYQRVNHTLKLLWQYHLQLLLLLLLLTVIVSRPCVTDPSCSLYSLLQAKSLYISWAVSYFFENEIEIWVGFGPAVKKFCKFDKVSYFCRCFSIY